MRLLAFLTLAVAITLGPWGFGQVIINPVPDPSKAKKDDKTKTDKSKKKDDKKKDDKKKEDSKPLQASIMAIDKERGLFIVSIIQDGGHYIWEYRIDDKTAFKSADGSEMKDGFANPAFKQTNERTNVPVDIRMEFSNGKPVIKEIKLSK